MEVLATTAPFALYNYSSGYETSSQYDFSQYELPNQLECATPAWAEIDRLKARKHLLTLRSSFRLIGGDREREQRRRKKQWQHWQSAMDGAIKAVLHEEALKRERELLKEKELKASVMALMQDVERRSPGPVLVEVVPEQSLISHPSTNVSKPISPPKIFPLRKRDALHLFMFDCPTAPLWPGLQENEQVDLACGKRLLARRSPVERAVVRRKTVWKSQTRSSSL